MLPLCVACCQPDDLTPSSLMLHHISASCSQSTFLTVAGPPRRVFVSGYLQWSSVLRCAQRFSIRFISGEIAAQFITENLCSSAAACSQSRVFLDTWGEALSCWNTKDRLHNCLDTNQFSHTFTYYNGVYYSCYISVNFYFFESRWKL